MKVLHPHLSEIVADAQPDAIGLAVVGFPNSGTEGFSPSVEEQVRERLSAILDDVGDAFCSLDRELRIAGANNALLTCLNRPFEELRGRSIWDILVHIRSPDLEQCFEMALSPARVSSRVEVALEPDGPTKLSIFSLGDGIGISFRDRSELRRADEVLRESQARISALADNLPLGMVYQMDNGVGYEHRRFVYVSASCERLNGIAAERVLEDPHLLFDLILPEHRDHVFKKLAMAHASAAAFDVEFAIRHARTGEVRWQRIVDAPRLLPDGTTVWDGIQIDITDHKAAEDHLQLLVNELNHRVKNTLTTVQSLAAQSFHSLESLDRENLVQSRSTFEARLFSLARSHDILTRESWEGACIRDIARQAVEPYLTPEHRDAFDLRGPALRLSPSLALSLSMAFHELCTNALKYGALQNPAGKVSLTWTAPFDTPPHITIEWKEHGGPAVSAPSRKGFGTRLIERLAREVGGTVQMDYAPDGFVCTVTAPIQNEYAGA